VADASFSSRSSADVDGGNATSEGREAIVIDCFASSFDEFCSMMLEWISI
jgi:hypothetical protein